jgi:hypothetical protein
MALELIKLVKGSSAVTQVGSLGFFKLGVESGGGSGGGDLTFSRVFGENTPEQISAVSAVISANNMTSTQVAETYGWNIGDTIDITLTTNEVITMRIIGFNHDNKSDGSGTAGITLEMVNCLNTKYSLRSDYTNAGGWKDTKLRTETLPTIKATLPTEWQSIIKLVDKKSTNGGGTNFTEVVTTSDDLFLLSQVELINEIGYAQSIEEGAVYEYWNGKANYIRRKKVGSSFSDWWLRSCGKQPSYFIYVNSAGNGQTSWGNSSYGISFAFCV